MSQRLDYSQLSPELAQSLFKVNMALGKSSLDKKMHDLINIRASQINGCAFCIDMHVKEARIHEERDLRVHHIIVWRESPLFSDRERAALEWTEAVTKLGEHGISDELYAKVSEQFSEKEISDLTFAIGTINFWNRLSISFKAVPGSRDKEYGLTKAGLT